jgi:hypothetical protein
LKYGWAEPIQRLQAHDGVIDLSSASVPVFAYEQPGGNKMKDRYWYNGVLAAAFAVTTGADHTGASTRKQVALIERAAFLNSECIHAIGTVDLCARAYKEYPKDKGFN